MRPSWSDHGGEYESGECASDRKKRNPESGWRDDSYKFLQYGGGSEYTAQGSKDTLLPSPDCAAGAIRAHFFGSVDSRQSTDDRR